MACSICLQNVCNCGASLCPEVDCEDPGILALGSHLQILDYKFCTHRLENALGFLVCSFAEGGTPKIFFTNEPCIASPELEVNVGDEISHISAQLGDAGCLRRLVPGDAADGWLRAINGVWMLSALPSENLPDPFERENIIVNETLETNELVVNTTACFDALPSDDVVDTVGLNAEGCLVKGSVSQIEAALFYESGSETSATTPNSPINANANAVIGNEIFDPQAIASVDLSTRINIDKAGSYLILWSGFFDREDGGGSNGDPTLNLIINSGIVSQGCGRAVRVNPPATAVIHGMHLVVLSVNDKIELRVGPTANATNNLLKDVKLVLIRYRST